MKQPAAKAPVKGGGGAGGGGGGKGAGTAGKHQAKAKAKPAKVSRAVHRARHATAVKAAKTRAANAKKVKQHPRRQLALGSAVACCSAEALAASLRLSGWPVSDADVLALYWHTARDEHAGASILATLEAAAEFGLAGVRPVSYRMAGRESNPRPPKGTVPRSPLPTPAWLPAIPVASVILGLALPAPHAVLDTGSEWMSWGESWPAWAFPDAVTEEAWEVTWPS